MYGLYYFNPDSQKHKLIFCKKMRHLGESEKENLRLLISRLFSHWPELRHCCK